MQNQQIVCEIHGFKEQRQNVNTDEQFQAKRINSCNLCVEKKLRQNQHSFLKEAILPFFNTQCQKNLETINFILQTLKKAKLKINYLIDEQITFVTDFAESLKNRVDELKNLLLSPLASSIQLIQQQQLNLLGYLKNFRLTLFEKLSSCETHAKQFKYEIMDKQFDLLEPIEEFPKVDHHFQPVMEENKQKQLENCQMIVFNLDDTILVAGCEQEIVFFQFYDKQLTQISQFNMNGQVIYLKFISLKSNKLVSIIENDYVYTWKQNSKQEFIIKQKIDIDTSNVVCVDLSCQWLALGSSYEKLEVWEQSNNNWYFMQTIRDSECILCVSLSQSGNKLISGGQNKKITIFELCENGKSWIFFQQIQVGSDVLRIRFFDDLFMSYEPQVNKISIYKFKGAQFQKENQMKLQGNGKDIQQYQIYHSRSGFLVKHANYLSFLNYSLINKRCELKSQVYLQNEFQGCLSNNEEYLIIWDEISKKLQVRQWMKLND